MMKNPFIKKQIEQKTTGSAQIAISISDLGEIIFPCPNKEKQKKCVEIFNKYLDEVNKIKEEKRILLNDLESYEKDFEEKIIEMLS